MAKTNDTYKCTKCSKEYPKKDRKLCTLCKTKAYCSNKCETADFGHHQKSCKFKEKTLELLHECALCEDKVEGDGVRCTTCFGIKYCSDECKRRNAKQHEDMCEAYVRLRPRPTQYHRLHILFEWNEMWPRFVWIDSFESVERFVATGEQQFEAMGPFDDYDEDFPSAYRSFCGFHNTSWSNSWTPCRKHNLSLGRMLTGRSSMCVMGNLLISATNHSEYREGEERDGGLGDAIPADIPKLLLNLVEHEMRNGGRFGF